METNSKYRSWASLVLILLSMLLGIFLELRVFYQWITGQITSEQLTFWAFITLALLPVYAILTFEAAKDILK